MSLPTVYQQFIHLGRYARWREDLGERRETWDETVDRYFAFFVPYLTENHGYTVPPNTVLALRNRVAELSVMPSMRCLMTAGRALARDHVCAYNCAYRPVDGIRAFDEILFILMCSTGVGFSVERQEVNQLPTVPETLDPSGTVVVVRDSKRGWAEALRELIGMLYAGRIPLWDVSRLRDAGARLKTMGGRSSGPEPLVDLFNFVVHTFQGARGRKLTSIECHDIVCKEGDCVLVGGVRRAALISLSNLSDLRMRDAKAGQWWETHPYRQVSNNSVAYTERPEVGQFMQEWLSLYSSKSGERGIFNREAARAQAARNGRRKTAWDEAGKEPIAFGTNPCSEIILRPRQFCNLTEVVARPDDTEAMLRAKVAAATVLGTWQACLTKFRYLTKQWRDNCEEERLLGVSLTGIMDSPLLNGRGLSRDDRAILLRSLRTHAVQVNREWAERLGIPASAAVTCVKPSGTVSQLVMSGAGIHSWHARQFVRRVRQDCKDPLTAMMVEAGFPHEPDLTKPGQVEVFSFPIRAPAGAVLRDDRTAVEELEAWLDFQDHWCEHKPSVTITVREQEWPEVGAWVWRHFDQMSGVSFLPHSEHTYRQAPYEEVSDEALRALEVKMPEKVDWTRLKEYEEGDQTTGTKEVACASGSCEV